MDAGASRSDETAEFWEALYRERPRIWSGKVNPVLAEEAQLLPAGRVLDLGCGEGGDAIWFAARGWTVTAVDVAQVALDRAAQHAAEAGVTGIAWERHDLTRSLPQGPFDLVSAQFLQSPLDFPRIDVLRSAAGTVVPGGVLLSVSHAAAPDWSNHRDHHFPSPLEELEELALDPDTWEVLRCEVVEREGTGPDGQPGILADGVIAVRRRGI